MQRSYFYEGPPFFIAPFLLIIKYFITIEASFPFFFTVPLCPLGVGGEHYTAPLAGDAVDEVGGAAGLPLIVYVYRSFIEILMASLISKLV